jgi:hypothetical protein
MRRISAAAALAAATYVVQLTDPDPWWHLATGRWIVAHHAIPRVDPFSFTMTGAEWRRADWLADLALYGSWVLGGNAGLAALMVLAAFGMLLFLGLTLLELGVPSWTASALTLSVGLMVHGRYSMARPMTLGALLLCVTLYLCARSRMRNDRSALLAAPVILLWSAIHPTALLGLTIVIVFTLTRPNRLWIAASLLSLVMAAPSLGGLLSVAGAHDQATLARALTTEWAAPRLSDREWWMPLLSTLAALLFVSDRRRALPWIACAAAGAVLASRYSRNLYEGILLSAPLWGLAAARVNRWALLFIVPAAHIALAPAEFNARFGVGPADGAVPVETLALLRRLPGGHLMNDCNAGGWLIWQDVPVYCDGRTISLYDRSAVERLFLPLYSGAAAVEAAADRFDVRYALSRHDSDFQDTLMRAPEWLPLAYDRNHALFVRRKYAATLPAGVLPLDELRYAADGAWLSAWYAGVAADPARAQRLEADVVRAATSCPSSRTLHAALHHLAVAQPSLAAQLKRALAAALR